MLRKLFLLVGLTSTVVYGLQSAKSAAPVKWTDFSKWKTAEEYADFQMANVSAFPGIEIKRVEYCHYALYAVGVRSARDWYRATWAVRMAHQKQFGIGPISNDKILDYLQMEEGKWDECFEFLNFLKTWARKHPFNKIVIMAGSYWFRVGSKSYAEFWSVVQKLKPGASEESLSQFLKDIDILPMEHSACDQRWLACKHSILALLNRPRDAAAPASTKRTAPRNPDPRCTKSAAPIKGIDFSKWKTAEDYANFQMAKVSAFPANKAPVTRVDFCHYALYYAGVRSARDWYRAEWEVGMKQQQQCGIGFVQGKSVFEQLKWENPERTFNLCRKQANELQSWAQKKTFNTIVILAGSYWFRNGSKSYAEFWSVVQKCSATTLSFEPTLRRFLKDIDILPMEHSARDQRWLVCKRSILARLNCPNGLAERIAQQNRAQSSTYPKRPRPTAEARIVDLQREIHSSIQRTATFRAGLETRDPKRARKSAASASASGQQPVPVSDPKRQKRISRGSNDSVVAPSAARTSSDHAKHIAGGQYPLGFAFPRVFEDDAQQRLLEQNLQRQQHDSALRAVLSAPRGICTPQVMSDDALKQSFELHCQRQIDDLPQKRGLSAAWVAAARAASVLASVQKPSSVSDPERPSVQPSSTCSDVFCTDQMCSVANEQVEKSSDTNAGNLLDLYQIKPNVAQDIIKTEASRETTVDV